MKRTFSAKRVPRKIITDNDESPGISEASQGGNGSNLTGKFAVKASSTTFVSDACRNVLLTHCTEPVVKRPVASKAKKRSSLRLSFGAGEASSEGGDDGGPSSAFTPKKPSLSRIAIEKNAERQIRPSAASGLVRSRAVLEEDRPVYNQDYLAELKNSTPSTPKDLAPMSDEEDNQTKELDIASKFGPSATLSPDETSAIPTEAVIREKKARRARLAKEQQAYISLGDDAEDKNWDSDDDDEFRTNKNEISLRPREKYPETRLVPDDEDIAEGFEEYVEDGGITIGRKAEREAQKKKRAEIAELIADAEQGSDDEASDDSEAERIAAYEEAQTRKGTYGQHEQTTDEGARTPPRVTPLPDLDQVLEQLQKGLRAKEQKREIMLKKVEELGEERVRIAERQKFVQEKLREAGDNFEKERQQAGTAGLSLNGLEGSKIIVNRGLESLGATPVPSREDSSDEELN